MSDVNVLRAGEKRDETKVAAVLAKYLPLGEQQAEGWAEIVCEKRAEPLPGEEASIVLERDVEGVPIRFGAPSGEGYTLREVQAAAKRYASELATNDRPAVGSLLGALKRVRKQWVRSRQEQLQNLGRRALPEETEETKRAREYREHQARQEWSSKIIADLTRSTSLLEALTWTADERAAAAQRLDRGERLADVARSLRVSEAKVLAELAQRGTK